MQVIYDNPAEIQHIKDLAVEVNSLYSLVFDLLYRVDELRRTTATDGQIIEALSGKSAPATTSLIIEAYRASPHKQALVRTLLDRSIAQRNGRSSPPRTVRR